MRDNFPFLTEIHSCLASYLFNLILKIVALEIPVCCKQDNDSPLFLLVAQM